MSLEQNLARVIAKFRSHPQLVGMEINLTDPNQTGAMGDTLLHFAVEGGTSEDVEVLVAAGAKVNAIGDIGNTPLHSAALLGRTTIAQKLLELGADPAIKNEFGESSEDVAKIGGHDELVMILKNRRIRPI